jgi:hypothetical protein
MECRHPVQPRPDPIWGAGFLKIDITDQAVRTVGRLQRFSVHAWLFPMMEAEVEVKRFERQDSNSDWVLKETRTQTMDMQLPDSPWLDITYAQ